MALCADKYEVERTALMGKSFIPSSPKYVNKNVQFQSPPREFLKADKSRLSCSHCGAIGHVSQQCYKKQMGEPGSPSRYKPAFGSRENREGSPARKLCWTCSSPSHLSINCPKRRDKDHDRDGPSKFRSVRAVTIDPYNAEYQETGSNEQQKYNYDSRQREQDQECTQDVPEPVRESSVNRIMCSSNLHLDEPMLCQVSFAGQTPVLCRQDTGADISLAHPRVLGEEFMQDHEQDFGALHIKGIFSDPIAAKVITIDAALIDGDEKRDRKERLQKSLKIVLALSEKYNGEHVLLTGSDYQDLMKMKESRMLTYKEALSKYEQDDSEDEDSELSAKIINKSIIDSVRVNYLNSKIDSPLSELSSCLDLSKPDVAEEFKKAQSEDSSLMKAWKEAEKEDSDFFKRANDNLLCNRKKIGALWVSRLVLPENYRSTVLDLAHASIFACHLKARKTLKRLQAYFYWPTIIKDVKQYVNRCASCQLIARKTKRDRVPIEEVERALQFGDMVNIDLIGPFQVASSNNHKYVLTLIDSCTRWPEAEPIKNLTAEEVCKALMRIFIRIGIPRVIVADNGTNMTADLTTRFCKDLGIELRHSTPYHPQGNSLVERLNGTIKRCIHHVINKSKNPRSWHEKLPYVLFAIREIPNETTGLSAFQLTFGRLLRGPLAVLSDNWSSSKVDPSLRRTEQQYLTDLKEIIKENMKIAESRSN